MASHRSARAEAIHDTRRLLEAMRACRHEALTACRGLRPLCGADREVQSLVDAIDRLAGHLTGDPTLFHDKGSTGQSGMVNGILVGRIKD